MRDYNPILSFGANVAAEYDATNVRGDEAETVQYLERLAGGGRVLELAIGTGRIALPLTERGVQVDGIELSDAMVDVLRAKPGAERIGISVGNFADVDVEGSYQLVYIVYNTFFNLLTQDDQVRCFENVAAHLTDDGLFVIEAFAPGYLFRLRSDQYVDAEEVEVDYVKLDVAKHDPVNQMLNESHVELSTAGVRVFPVVCRYCWPSELDLMARIAGLRLKERWGGWENEPYTSASVRHVSVYGR